MTDIDTDTRELLAAGTAIAKHDTFPRGSEPRLVVVPDGYRAEVVEAIDPLTEPERKTGSVKLHDLDSLIGYVSHHHDAAHTTLYVDANKYRVEAVINDHAGTDEPPAFRDHRAALDLQTTPEWDAWVSRNGQLMGQIAFAEFIEDNAKDVQSPEPATLLEIAQTFQSKSEVNFRSTVRLQSGAVQVTYSEDVTAQAGTSGTLEIPDTFELALKPFVGGARYGVVAKLRWRCSGGDLKLGYKLERIEDVIRYALVEDETDGVVPKLRAEFDRVYLGVPFA